MNNQQAFELNKRLNSVGIRCVFPRSSKKYTYKTQLLDVAVNDVLIVQTHSGYATVTVKEIVEITEANLRFLDSIGYDNALWAFQRVDKLLLEELKIMEHEVGIRDGNIKGALPEAGY